MTKVVKPYGEETQSKKQEVATMFNNISGRYDFLNHFLSLGIDKLWRRKAVKQLKELKPQKILDIATGTGDFALALLKLKPKEIIGVDIVRHSNGLAMSSRNGYLSKVEQKKALNLRETLLEAKAIFFSNKKETLEFLENTKKNDSSWDYIELLDSSNLSTPTEESSSLILAGAYKLGAARIIDNITFEA